MTSIQRNIQPQYQRVRDDIRDNSGKVAVGGAAGTAAFATMRKSTQIANGMTRFVQNSTKLTQTKKLQLTKLFSKVKWLNNPVMRKLTGPLAIFSAASAVIASGAKIADTCNYLQGSKDIANA